MKYGVNYRHETSEPSDKGAWLKILGGSGLREISSIAARVRWKRCVLYAIWARPL